MKVLITGGAGLIGSACCKLFSEKGWQVTSVDNNTRKKIFGKEADTSINLKEYDLHKDPNITHIETDIRDEEAIKKVIKDVDAVIHCAAQPSHPRSLEIPMEDFQINAYGTLLLLEIVRNNNPKIPFAFLSTNKVYGDYPNYFNYKIVNQRYENTGLDSFDETLSIDRCGHTPFGVSKVAATFIVRNMPLIMV